MRKGCWVAAVTPMSVCGKIDYVAWRNLLNSFLQANVSGVVVLGTTAESVNITMYERSCLLEIASEVLSGIEWFVGVGHASMDMALEYSAHAISYKPSGLMVVTPYYNRPMVDGLIEYFQRIIALGFPVMAYNVPSRTGIDANIAVWDELYHLDNFVAIKEANIDLMRVPLLVSRYPRLNILSGNDCQLLPFMRLGGHGIVSVLANVVPNELSSICESMLAGDLSQAKNKYDSLEKLHLASERAVNPIAIKCIMHSFGLIDIGVRLPLKITKAIYSNVIEVLDEPVC